jgi:uncharacterized protein (AIM24 family)
MSGEGGWYYVKNGQTVGPMSREELIQAIPSAGGPATLIWGPGVNEWTEARHVVSLGAGATHTAAPPRPPKARRADEIDYEIFGDDMQFVEVTLDPGEVVIAEAGGMMYMSDGIEMQTVFGDPSKEQGFLGKLVDAGKRIVTGESLFLTTFGAASNKREQVAFAAPYPGKIIPMHLDELGGELICQKEAFLCAARGVQIGIAFQKKILVGLFGGEGFILQRLTGDGLAFVHAGGTIHRRELAAGRVHPISSGVIEFFAPHCTEPRSEDALQRKERRSRGTSCRRPPAMAGGRRFCHVFWDAPPRARRSGSTPAASSPFNPPSITTSR